MDITSYSSRTPSRNAQRAIIAAGYGSRLLTGQLVDDVKAIGGVMKRGAEFVGHLMSPPETKRMRGSPLASIPEDCEVGEAPGAPVKQRYYRERRLPYYLW